MSPKIPKYSHHEETEIQRLLGSPSDSFHIVSCGILVIKSTFGWFQSILWFGHRIWFCYKQLKNIRQRSTQKNLYLEFSWDPPGQDRTLMAEKSPPSTQTQGAGGQNVIKIFWTNFGRLSLVPCLVKLLLHIGADLVNWVRIGLGDEDDDQGVLHLLQGHVLQHRLQSGDLQEFSKIRFTEKERTKELVLTR